MSQEMMKMVRHRNRVLSTAFAGATALLVLAAAACSSESGTSPSASAAQGPIRLGLIAGLTGPSDAWSVPFVKGAELAVEDWNAQGTGPEIELITEDNQSSPETSINNVTKLMSSDEVDFIVCSCDSGQFVPIVARINQENTSQGGEFVVSNGVAGTTEILDLPPVYISAFPLNGELAKQLAQGAWDEGLRTAYVLSGTDAYGVDMHTQLQVEWEAVGGTVVGETLVSPDLSDYTSVMRQIDSADPDVIFTGTYGADLVLQFREITEMGNRAPWYLLYPETAEIAGLPDSDNRGFGLSPGWLGDQASEWVTHYEEATGDEAGLFAAQGYDNTWLAALAVANRASTSVEATKQAYVEAAATYSGPSGTFAFDTQFARIDAAVTWSKIEGGEWVQAEP